jgi:cyclin-dependent kinase
MYISQILTISLAAALAVHGQPVQKPKELAARSWGRLFHWPRRPPPFRPSITTMASSTDPPTNNNMGTGSPRLVMYQQTHHDPDGKPISLLPLITEKTGITHLYIAAIHLNGGANVTLNNHAPDDPRHDQLWLEVRQLQDAGVKVMGMLGGAAKGSFARLSGSQHHVRSINHYAP